MRATAEILDPEPHPPQEASAPTTAVLHEFRAITNRLERVERLLLPQLRPQPATTQPTRALTDGTFIDQRSGLVPKDVYLRLARAGAFPSKKHGKRILARWGDVQSAVLGGPGITKTSAPSVNEERGGDDLNYLRRQLGFVEKGK